MKLLGEEEYKACYLVPARKSSVRIPHKNVRKIKGIELVRWPESEARELGIDYIVSTNCPKVKKVCRYYDIQFCERPERTDSNELSTLDLLQYHAKSMDWYDFYGLRQCTSPFLATGTALFCFALAASTGKCVTTISHEMRKIEAVKTGALYVVPRNMIQLMKCPDSWIFITVSGAEAVDIDEPSDLKEARTWASRI